MCGEGILIPALPTAMGRSLRRVPGTRERVHVIYLGVILEYSNRVWRGETGKGREPGQGTLMSRFLRAQLRLNSMRTSVERADTPWILGSFQPREEGHWGIYPLLLIHAQLRAAMEAFSPWILALLLAQGEKYRCS